MVRGDNPGPLRGTFVRWKLAQQIAQRLQCRGRVNAQVAAGFRDEFAAQTPGEFDAGQRRCHLQIHILKAGDFGFRAANRPDPHADELFDNFSSESSHVETINCACGIVFR
jgi:hypothetical protein